MTIIIYGADSRKIISTREFQAFNMAQKYIELSERTGINFDAVVELMEHLPIFLNDDQHKYQRRALAKIYAASKVQQEKNVDEALIRINQKIQLCEGKLDILSEISDPIWHAVGSALSHDFDFDAQLISKLPDLFYPNFSIRRRKILNDRLAKELSKISDNEREDILQKISVLTLGVRPLTHSLALSIHKISTENDQKMLSTINYPESYADSSLRFIDRIASRDMNINGTVRTCGERLRCISFDESYSEKENAKYIFGTGGHVCLGRPISNYIWKGITSILKATEKIIAPSTLKLAAQEPFLMAEVCKIEIRSQDGLYRKY